jgi:hypothetical protein
MPVLGFVGHSRLEAFDLAGIDFCFFEGEAHRLVDARGLRVGEPVLDEVSRHLVEDAVAPKWRVQLELSEPEQGVAKREGVEDIGVEDGAERHLVARLPPRDDRYR